MFIKMVTSLPPPTCLHRRLVRQAPKLDGQVALILLVLTLGGSIFLGTTWYHPNYPGSPGILFYFPKKLTSSCAWGFCEFWECRCQYECRKHSLNPSALPKKYGILWYSSLDGQVWWMNKYEKHGFYMVLDDFTKLNHIIYHPPYNFLW